jgi:hypothetical protein
MTRCGAQVCRSAWKVAGGSSRAGVRDRAELAAAGTVVAADGTSALHQTRDCPGREGEALGGFKTA